MSKISLIRNACFMVLTCLGASSAIAAEQADSCSEERMMTYFPVDFVQNTLAKFNVPKDRWDAITQDLQAKDPDLVRIVEEKASRMNPNPLKDPSQRSAAVQIFRETLLEIFTTAMNQNGISDKSQILSMMEDVQRQKAEEFTRCMEKNPDLFRQQQGANDQTAPEAEEEQFEWNK